MIRTLIICCILTLANIAGAQYHSGVTYPDSAVGVITDTTDLAVKYARTISIEDMKRHLNILASDDFEGRETGTRGNDKASQYLARQLETFGVDTVAGFGYYQPVDFSFSSWNYTTLGVNGESYRHLWEYLAFPNLNRHQDSIEIDEVLYLGYGIEDEQYNDYRKKDVRGKVIMISEGDPMDKDSISWVTGTREPSSWTIERKLELAKSKGVAMVLIITENIKELLMKHRRKLLSGTMELKKVDQDRLPTPQHLYISTTIAKKIISSCQKKYRKNRKRILRKGKSKPITFKTSMIVHLDKSFEVLSSRNVMAFIPGRDSLLGEEMLVVSAHYDHLGKRGDDVYNGADDNGSGTTTILEICEAFQKAAQHGEGPRRSVLFLWFTGEEKGLLGSQYYTTFPVFSLERTIANINVDMVGRVDKKYTDTPNYIYAIGSDRLSHELHNINETVNQRYTQLILDYKYNDENDPNRYYYRSDHYNFAEQGIPSIFFFNGTHVDYHRVSDTVEKINFDKMERVGRHIFHLAWELANRQETITADTSE